jgi:glycerol uptake facilitator-like aquaporin
VAEFIGTFPLIFIGAGAISLGANYDPPGAFAQGLTIQVFVAALGDISGGHFNPAVTIGSQQRACFQPVAGGIAAAWVLLLAFAGPWPTLAPHWSISAMSTSKVRPPRGIDWPSTRRSRRCGPDSEMAEFDDRGRFGREIHSHGL